MSLKAAMDQPESLFYLFLKGRFQGLGQSTTLTFVTAFIYWENSSL